MLLTVGLKERENSLAESGGLGGGKEPEVRVYVTGMGRQH